MNPKILFALVLIALLAAAGTLSALSPSLKDTSATGIVPMDAEEYRSVTSMRQMEGLVEREILRRSPSARDFNPSQLALDFENLGDDFSTRHIEGGGTDDRNVLRLTVDNRDRLIGLVPAPGGSNGVFTTIISYDEDEIIIIERGGIKRWLKLD